MLCLPGLSAASSSDLRDNSTAFETDTSLTKGRRNFTFYATVSSRANGISLAGISINHQFSFLGAVYGPSLELIIEKLLVISMFVAVTLSDK